MPQRDVEMSLEMILKRFKVIVVFTLLLLLLLSLLSPENNNMLRDHEKTNINMNCFLPHFKTLKACLLKKYSKDF